MKAFLLRHVDLLTAVAVLLLLSLLAAGPLFTRGWIDPHEATDPLERVLAIGVEVGHGDLYPRWLSASHGGKGSPFTNFYPPGFYLVAAWLSAAGVPLLVSLKLVLTALFLVGALGMYFWTRRHAGSAGALLAAALYLFAPYHFVDLYVRGALSEFAALALLPYLLLGIDRSFEGDGRRGATVTAATSAALVVTHALSAYMIALLAAPYALVLAWRNRADRRLLLTAAAGPVLGAGLSAFYWLPMILEQRHLRGLNEMVTSGYYRYDQHFVYLGQLFSTRWDFGGSAAGPDDTMSFQLGVVLMLGFLGSVVAWVKLDPAKRSTLLTMQVLALAAVLFTTAVFGLFYRIVPGLSLVQFPWRFLGPAGLFMAAAGGMALQPLGSRAASIASALGILLCIVLSGQQRVARVRPELERFNEAAMRRTVLEGRMLGALCIVDEYLPKGVSPTAQKLALRGPMVLRAPGMNISELRDAGSSLTFRAEVPSPGSTVTVPWFYFPGWEAEVDGVPVAVSADAHGFVTFALGPGSHAVDVRFGSTGPRRTGWIVAVLSLAALLTFLRRSFVSTAHKTAAQECEHLP